MTLTLAAADYELVLVPQIGGAIGAFTWRGLPVLQPVADRRLAAQHGAALGGYPLIPYANRIAGGTFTLHGKTERLRHNFGDAPYSIHGNGWMRPWSVESAGAAAAVLSLRHAPPADPADEWPFAYVARQSFHLSGAGLAVHLVLRNMAECRWPAGLGLHPYVSRTAQTTLAFAAEGYWRTGPDEMPEEHCAIAGNKDFTRPRPAGAEEIDCCYTGWAGTAAIAWPEHRARLRIAAAPPFRFFQVYTPAGRDFCGLEPVTHMPDAIHRLDSSVDHGLVWLEPGEEIEGEIRFSVEADE